MIAGVSTFVAWAVTGLFLSLIPSFVTTVLKLNNRARAGAVVAALLIAAVVAGSAWAWRSWVRSATSTRSHPEEREPRRKLSRGHQPRRKQIAAWYE